MQPYVRACGLNAGNVSARRSGRNRRSGGATAPEPSAGDPAPPTGRRRDPDGRGPCRSALSGEKISSRPAYVGDPSHFSSARPLRESKCKSTRVLVQRNGDLFPGVINPNNVFHMNDQLVLLRTGGHEEKSAQKSREKGTAEHEMLLRVWCRNFNARPGTVHDQKSRGFSIG